MSQLCMSRDQFLRQKNQCLSGTDLSRKGSVDSPIFDIVAFINEQPGFFTTSSCSGRIIMFDNAGADNIKKKGCHWLYVTHDQACFEEIKRSLLSSQGAAVFKFEPMIMHIQVHTLSDAQKLHTTAVASGFRNSGISIGGKGKIIVAVRSTHSLEVPLSFGGQVLVSDDYIKHLVECGNKKMQENMSRIQKFFEHLQAMVEKIKSELCDEQKKTRIKQEPVSRGNGAGNLQQTSVVPSRSSESELLAMKSNDLASLEDDFSEWLFTET